MAIRKEILIRLKNVFIPHSLGIQPKPHKKQVWIFSWIWVLLSIIFSLSLVLSQSRTVVETRLGYDGNQYLLGQCDNVESFKTEYPTLINQTVFQIIPSFSHSLASITLQINQSQSILLKFPLNKPFSYMNGTSYYSIYSTLSSIYLTGNGTTDSRSWGLIYGVDPGYFSLNVSVLPTSRARCDFEVSRSMLSQFAEFATTFYTLYMIMPFIVLIFCNDSVVKSQNEHLESVIVAAAVEEHNQRNVIPEQTSSIEFSQRAT